MMHAIPEQQDYSPFRIANLASLHNCSQAPQLLRKADVLIDLACDGS